MFYTYYIKARGKVYIGSRTSKKCLERTFEEDFMKHYKSSTKNQELRKLINNGEIDSYGKIKDYDDAKECVIDENEMIRLFWLFFGKEKSWNGSYSPARGEVIFSTAGIKFSDEIRKRISEGHKGKTHSEESRKKISEANKGKIVSEEHRKKIKEALINMPEEKKQAIIEKIRETNNNKPEEEKQAIYKKISEGHIGKTHSEETKKQMSENRKGEGNGMYGKTHSEASRKKISEANKGKYTGEKNPMYGRRGEKSPIYGTHQSEEHRKKISMANKGKPKPKFYWQTPEGEIKTMNMRNALKWHPDWIFIGPVED